MDYIPELQKYPKFRDVQQLYSQAAGSGITLCNNINAGVDDNARIGRKITMKALRFHLVMGPEGGLVSNWNTVRVMVIYDTQTNGNTTPAYTDIFNGSGITTFENPDNRKRFYILKEWLFQLPRYDVSVTPAFSGNSVSGKTFVVMDEYIPLNHETTYNGTSGTQISTGSLLLYTQGNNVATPSVIIRLTTRIYYEDQ